MKTSFQKFSGYSLIIGSIMMVLTMVLHPVGCNLDHIIKVSKLIIVSHSLAIFSIPFIGFGFLGLSKSLETPTKMAYLGFMFIIFGLFAVMMAASINGLILPMYALEFSNETGQKLEIVKLIIAYGSKFNKAMDYIFICGYSAAMLIWSVIIIQTSKLPRWIGFYGITLLGLTLIASIMKFNFISVWGFRFYIFGIVSWILVIGFMMLNRKYTS